MVVSIFLNNANLIKKIGIICVLTFLKESNSMFFIQEVIIYEKFHKI